MTLRLRRKLRTILSSIRPGITADRSSGRIARLLLGGLTGAALLAGHACDPSHSLFAQDAAGRVSLDSAPATPATAVPTAAQAGATPGHASPSLQEQRLLKALRGLNQPPAASVKTEIEILPARTVDSVSPAVGARKASDAGKTAPPEPVAEGALSGPVRRKPSPRIVQASDSKLSPQAKRATTALGSTAPLTPVPDLPAVALFDSLPGVEIPVVESNPAEFSLPAPPATASVDSKDASPLFDSPSSNGTDSLPLVTTEVPVVPAVVTQTETAAIADQQPQSTAPTKTAAHPASFGTTTGYAHRMNRVLGRTYDDSESIDQYWHDQSVLFVEQNRHTAVEVAQAVDQVVEHFVNIEYLSDHPAPDVDIYDMKPHLSATGPVRTAAMNLDHAVPGADDRLTRDLTSIQPTLGYALRNIDERALPEDFFDHVDRGEYQPRQSNAVVLQWAPTNLWHHPLYFEDPALERYGHTYHPIVQPFASTGRFMTQLAGLPYQMSLNPMHSRQYPLGWYRPGEYAPKKLYQIPYNQDAAVAEIATIAGLILIFP
ncbi:MAG: hypothetical protein KDA96_24790 [Planctomycetaceae bacterium]|nr:hypothetical protein [Planctomycetaceae bacterium]